MGSATDPWDDELPGALFCPDEGAERRADGRSTTDEDHPCLARRPSASHRFARKLGESQQDQRAGRGSRDSAEDGAIRRLRSLLPQRVDTCVWNIDRRRIGLQLEAAEDGARREQRTLARQTAIPGDPEPRSRLNGGHCPLDRPASLISGRLTRLLRNQGARHEAVHQCDGE